MKQRLFRDWRGLVFVLIATLCVTIAASPNVGYLRRVGPAPLRFSPMPRPCVAKFVLPKPAPESETAPIAAQIGNALVAASAPQLPAVIEQAHSGAPKPPMETAPPEGVVPPQIFLKYFNQSTNQATNQSTNIAAPSVVPGVVPGVVPMNFNPPKPAGPAPSSATYSTGP